MNVFECVTFFRRQTRETFGPWVGAALLGLLSVGCQGVDSPTTPEAAIEVGASSDGWVLIGDAGVIASLVGGGDAAMTCNGNVDPVTQAASVVCSCPATMHFDGGGACECDNGGDGIDCDMSGGTTGGGTGGTTGGQPGGGTTPDPPDPHDPQDENIQVTLSCGTLVVRGSPTTCDLVSSNPTVTTADWKFIAFDVSNLPEKSGGMSWSGTMVVSGTVVATWSHNGNLHTSSVAITVVPRSWSWDSSLSKGQATGTGNDGCFQSGHLGLTFGSDCYAPLQRNKLLTPWGKSAGFVIGQGSGPNAGIFYVQSKSKTMNLRWNVARRWRSDGPVYPLAGNATVSAACAVTVPTATALGHYSVNTKCSFTPMPNYSAFLSAIGTHEGTHLDLGYNAAMDGTTNDLWRNWEGIVSDVQGEVQSAAEQFAEAANTNIWNAAKAPDLGNPPVTIFWLYRYSTGWIWQALEVKN
jgi:hypothetical protein